MRLGEGEATKAKDHGKPRGQKQPVQDEATGSRVAGTSHTQREAGAGIGKQTVGDHICPAHVTDFILSSTKREPQDVSGVFS